MSRRRTSLATAKAQAEAFATGQPAPKATARRSPRHIEDSHQAALFAWAARAEGIYPELSLLYAVPNGGRRDGLEASRLKAQGVKAGVPDITLPVAVPLLGYIGLRIELKRPIVKGEDKPRVSPEQAAWLTRLQRADHCCCVCHGWEQARECIQAYLAAASPVPHQWTQHPI